MLRRALWLAALTSLLSAPGCAVGGIDEDAGTPPMDSGSPRDAGRDARVPLADAGLRDAGPPPDTGPLPDTGPPVDAGAPSDAGVDAHVPPGSCTPTADNLVIAEIMIASQSGGGDQGEWFEIKNLTACTVNLAGLVIEGKNSALADVSYTVGSGLVSAGGFYVFAQNANPDLNHGLMYNDVYGASDIVFTNSSGSLTLRYEGAVIDTLAWGSTDHRPGAARQLDRAATSGGGALGGASWCDATAIYSDMSGGPFLGTPRMINAACTP